MSSGGNANQRPLSGTDPPAVFTVGYSGHTPGSLAALLRGAGAKQVIDVRSFPVSRKPGFSKTPLSTFLQSQGLTYVHLPLLGAPRVLLTRKKADDLPFSAIAGAYEKHLARQGAELDQAMGLARERTSVLLCLEKDASECHRGILARRFAREGFSVVHL